MKKEFGKTTRGRPRSFDRAAALERALALFWQQGYEGTSLAELTEVMGITPPSLYAAFGSKSELFFEAVELYARTHGSTGQALAEEPTARAAVARLLREAAIHFTLPANPPGCLMISAAMCCSPASADIEAAMRQRRIVSEAAMRERIVQGIAAGELPADTNAALLTKFYAAVFQGMSVQSRDGATREELEEVAETAMRAWPGNL